VQQVGTAYLGQIVREFGGERLKEGGAMRRRKRLGRVVTFGQLPLP
jgi:hypothetical protein